MQPPLRVPAMLLRYCEPGEHYVPASEAPLLRTVQAGLDAGRRVYACREHEALEGAPPTGAAFIGSRDNAPTIAPQESP